MNRPEREPTQQLHWTYRLLRRFMIVTGTIIFWAWLIILALSGKI